MNKMNRNEWFTILAGIIIIVGVIIFVGWSPQNGETVSGSAAGAATGAAQNAGSAAQTASGTAATAGGQNNQAGSQTNSQSNQSNQVTNQNMPSSQSQSGQTPALSSKPLGQNISTNPNIQIYDLVVGTGTVAATGNTVSVTYVGALQDGTIFDASSEHGGQPFSFTLGAGQVIAGWDIGVTGMKVGGLRRLVISPTLGYGTQAVGPIPANSTLTFDVTLLGVK